MNYSFLNAKFKATKPFDIIQLYNIKKIKNNNKQTKWWNTEVKKQSEKKNS